MAVNINVLDEDGLWEVRRQRVLFTNHDLIRNLCGTGVPLPEDTTELHTYMSKVELGLYLMGWRIQSEPALSGGHGAPFYVTTDEFTPLFTLGGAVGMDTLMWRSAAHWASSSYRLRKKIQAYTVLTDYEKEFLTFYQEFLLP